MQCYIIFYLLAVFSVISPIYTKPLDPPQIDESNTITAGTHGHDSSDTDVKNVDIVNFTKTAVGQPIGIPLEGKNNSNKFDRPSPGNENTEVLTLADSSKYSANSDELNLTDKMDLSISSDTKIDTSSPSTTSSKILNTLPSDEQSLGLSVTEINISSQFEKSSTLVSTSKSLTTVTQNQASSKLTVANSVKGDKNSPTPSATQDSQDTHKVTDEDSFKKKVNDDKSNDSSISIPALITNEKEEDDVSDVEGNAMEPDPIDNGDDLSETEFDNGVLVSTEKKVNGVDSNETAANGADMSNGNTLTPSAPQDIHEVTEDASEVVIKEEENGNEGNDGENDEKKNLSETELDDGTLVSTEEEVKGDANDFDETAANGDEDDDNSNENPLTPSTLQDTHEVTENGSEVGVKEEVKDAESNGSPISEPDLITDDDVENDENDQDDTNEDELDSSEQDEREEVLVVEGDAEEPDEIEDVDESSETELDNGIIVSTEEEEDNNPNKVGDYTEVEEDEEYQETFDTDHDDENIDFNEAFGENIEDTDTVVEEERQSHFFAFILTAMFCTAAAYLLYHNKRKVIALVLPGTQRRTGQRQRGGYNANYERLENKSSGKTYKF